MHVLTFCQAGRLEILSHQAFTAGRFSTAATTPGQPESAYWLQHQSQGARIMACPVKQHTACWQAENLTFVAQCIFNPDRK